MPLPPLITPCPAMLEEFDCLTPLPVKRFPSKLAPNVTNNFFPKKIPNKNSPFCSFSSF